MVPDDSVAQVLIHDEPRTLDGRGYGVKEGKKDIMGHV